MIKHLIKLGLVIPFSVAISYFIYNHHWAKFQSQQQSFINELNKYPFKSVAQGNDILISHSSEDPKFWLKFLAQHNLYIKQYQLTSNSFIATVAIEYPAKLTQVITTDLSPSFTKYQEEKQFQISFIKKKSM